MTSVYKAVHLIPVKFSSNCMSFCLVYKKKIDDKCPAALVDRAPAGQHRNHKR
jgi:hypothetical protein